MNDRTVELTREIDWLDEAVHRKVISVQQREMPVAVQHEFSQGPDSACGGWRVHLGWSRLYGRSIP
ncbi:MAG: hypothetical protein ACT4OZ_01115 [Gemmatimonadota bacterium]